MSKPFFKKHTSIENVPSNNFLKDLGIQVQSCQELFNQFQTVTVFDSEVQKNVERLIEEGRHFRNLRYETADHSDQGKIYARDVQQILLDFQQGGSKKNGRDVLKGLKDEAIKYLNHATKFRDQYAEINHNVHSIANDLKRRDNELQLSGPGFKKQLEKSQKSQQFHDSVAKKSGIALGIFGTAAIIAAPFTFGTSAIPGTLAVAASATLIGSTTAAGGITFTASTLASDARRKAKAAEMKILEISTVVEEIGNINKGIDDIGQHLANFINFWGEIQAQIDYLLNTIYKRFSINQPISTTRAIKMWKDIEQNYNAYSLCIREY